MSVIGTDVDASVSYYGIGLAGLVPEFDKIEVPVLAHIAELDKFVPAAERDEVLAAWAGKPGITAHVYAGQDHAFARVGGEHYSADAANLANTRTADFLHAALAA